ncbi:MAG: triose-phosphate isomerase [Candidatus Moranbacteria bacterium]|nr:triose-phosphate isomerase [Candidatus Moranbacteria bacterium]
MYFIANWKMNPVSLKEAKNLLKNIKTRISKVNKSKIAKIIVCPPAIYLPKLATKNKLLDYGVQNIAWIQQGAITGEISILMAKEFAIKYCIVGHSERKQFLCESDRYINEKIKLCLKNNIIPIFCIGENLEQKESGQTGKVLKEQIFQGLQNVDQRQVKKIIIAYEPVWAISSQQNSQPSNPDSVLEATIIIKKALLNLYGRETSGQIPIIYGGSVNKDNVLDYIGGNIEGFLIGSASLNAYDFISIIEKSLIKLIQGDK